MKSGRQSYLYFEKLTLNLLLQFEIWKLMHISVNIYIFWSLKWKLSMFHNSIISWFCCYFKSTCSSFDKVIKLFILFCLHPIHVFNSLNHFPNLFKMQHMNKIFKLKSFDLFSIYFLTMWIIDKFCKIDWNLKIGIFKSGCNFWNFQHITFDVVM